MPDGSPKRSRVPADAPYLDHARIGGWSIRYPADDEGAEESSVSVPMSHEMESLLRDYVSSLQRALKEPEAQKFLLSLQGFRSLIDLPGLQTINRQELTEAARSILDLEEALDEAKRRQEAPRPKKRRTPTPPVPAGDYMEVPSPAAYRALQAIVQDPSRFKEGNPWPYAIPDQIEGLIEARPPIVDLAPFLEADEEARLRDLMWEQVGKLGDLDADVLDILAEYWLRQAKHPDQKVVCTVAYVLERRGLKRKAGGAGRRGGYYSSQENRIREAIGRIGVLWVEADVESYVPQPGKRRPQKQRTRMASRAFVVDSTAGQLRLDGRVELEAFTYSPGALFGRFLFGPGRQTAMQSVKSLLYHPLKEQWEKRLARYLPWLWRCDAKNGSGVKSFRRQALLDAIGQTPNRARPGETRERLDRALDRLKADGVIRCWQDGPGWDAGSRGRCGWFEEWLMGTVVISAPDEVSDQYRSIVQAVATAEPRRAITPPSRSAEDLAARLRARRKAAGMSLLQAGEALGVSGRAVGQWESGARTPSADARKRILTWLNDGTAEGS